MRPSTELVTAAILWALGGLLLGVQAAAQETPWAPPEPSDTEFDWVQLKSGEWLKGEFERLRDRKVSFDSDELEDLELDFEDVAAFRLPRPHSYRVGDRVVYRGSGEMREGVVRVRTRGGVVEFQRDDLDRIVEGEGRELDRWSAIASLGLAVRQGNTDQVDITGLLDVRRESALTRWSLDYDGVLSSVDQQRNANSHRVFTGFDVYLTRRFFVTAPFFEFFSDEFQNIDQRYTPGAGLGYELVRRRWVEWDVTGGAAYQRTVYSTTSDANDFATVLGTEVDFDFRSFDWDNLYRVQIVPTDPGRTSQHFESVFSLDIWGPLDLDVSFIWDRIADPEPDANGVQPESDDVRLSVGIGLDL